MQERLSRSPQIRFPPELPITARRVEIEAALTAHQVIIVCGETGSGKTTQLPKMMLAMGRGRLNAAPGQRGRLIGHTQPRRIAAVSVARRIAEELDSPLGEVVGYQVRFHEQVGQAASVKLMTDGILLAETQGDPLLDAYDTLIIDEAHERSLNIDFLLGYLRQILPRRPDLKLIITSATLDADRFARHFGTPVTPDRGQAGAAGTKNVRPEGAEASIPAPVLTVSGRLYPVEVRWRPFEEERDHGLNEAVAEALDELWQEPGKRGDVLVFLPGEREIRGAAQHLRKHLARDPALRGVEVLPLFARLSHPEQARIFERHGALRVVLATNVAETSLTVPGICCVIDSGTARVKRYSYRSKVERLLVEPISQAAASQRAGRCGRVADGICIRLYGEKEFERRPRFTDPEILRSSLAGVILRMKSLNLLAGDARVEDFPFLQPPTGRAIADGMQLLGELGAVDDSGALTPVGRELAQLPLDPRVGRMIIAGRDAGALREVLVVASALSVPDVRERPLELQDRAAQQHAKFEDARSEFSGYLKLWQWLEDARTGREAASREQLERQMNAIGRDDAPPGTGRVAHLPVQQRAAAALDAARVALDAAGHGHPVAGHKRSHRQYEQVLRTHLISPRRVREWRDVHRQLQLAANQRKWRENSAPAGYEALHRALLCGLLGNVGCRIEGENSKRNAAGEYLGARGIKFFIHPGVALFRRPGRWIVCAELVETTRLYGRGVAEIDPRWLEAAAAHLITRQVLQPHWEKKAGAVMAQERGLLYGLVVYQGRRTQYAQVDPVGAREIMIREALTGGDWPAEWSRSLPFLQHNRRVVEQIEALEHKSRRRDLLVDPELIHAFYDARIPAGVSDGRKLQQWYARASGEEPGLLKLSREDLLQHDVTGISNAGFPRLVRLAGVDCNASYLHAPGEPQDGLTVALPLFVVNQVDAGRTQWLVPGMLAEKVEALLRSLPQKQRNRLRPLPQTATRLAGILGRPELFGHGELLHELAGLVREETALETSPQDFSLGMLEPHLFMNFRVLDEHGRQLAIGRDLAAIRGELGARASGAFQALAGLHRAAPTAATPPVQAPVAATGVKEDTARKAADGGAPVVPAAGATLEAGQRFVDWDFGELPELLELQQGKQTLIGFPALVDAGDAVTLEVFDQPEVAAARHQAGLRRLFALQVPGALRQLRRDVAAGHALALAYRSLGDADDLCEQIVNVSMKQAFLEVPLPRDRAAFQARLAEGRQRLLLVAREVVRLVDEILGQYALATRRIRETKIQPAALDAHAQLQRLMPKDFLESTPWPTLKHFPRYLRAVSLRFDKLRDNPERDARHMAETQALEKRFWRQMAGRGKQQDERIQELRWILEELRVSLFAQELGTPRPVSAKRLEKAWARMHGRG